jgi:hypothetical protein
MDSSYPVSSSLQKELGQLLQSYTRDYTRGLQKRFTVVKERITEQGRKKPKQDQYVL